MPRSGCRGDGRGGHGPHRSCHGAPSADHPVHVRRCRSGPGPSPRPGVPRSDGSVRRSASRPTRPGRSVATSGSSRDGTPGSHASARTSRSFAAKASGSPVWPYSPPRKPPWSLGKMTGCRAEPLGGGDRRRGGPSGPRTPRRRPGRSGSTPRAGRRSRARSGCRSMMFWTEQRVGPGAVVLGRQPEHRRIGRRLGGELRWSSGPCGSRRR